MCQSIFYLLLDHWRDRNEIFRDRRHQPLDGYYILKTYCYYVNLKVICEKPVSRLIMVAHIYTYLAQVPTSLTTSYFPFYLLPPFLPTTSISTSYFPFYLLPPFLPTTSISTSYFPFYLLPPTSLTASYLFLTSFLPPTSLSISHFLKTQRYH